MDNKKFIADLHIHSHYSIATSKNLVPEYLAQWAGYKGIDVIGTGDCVHPGWLAELKQKLEPAGNGLFRLKKSYQTGIQSQRPVFFMLTGEISNIYRKNAKVRKNHNLCIFPDYDAVERVQSKLYKIGNIESDGRPILGLDSKNLLEMVLESSEQSFLIPAHIWTPWFSVLGSKSGFDSIEECYDDLTPYIFALETGLSSDPEMNRYCSFLDGFALVSNSDAHSPEKLGREANIFDTELSYPGIYNALKNHRHGDIKGFLGTVEFFPQEGKYHLDGHRKCNICWQPGETVKNKGICPVCGKEVTRGVMYRVMELADRDKAVLTDTFRSVTPLPNILAEILRKNNLSSKAVREEYLRLINDIGPEFYILLDAELDEIRHQGSEALAAGIDKLRKGEIIIQDGFDGEFGRIKVFGEGELDDIAGNWFTGIKVENKKTTAGNNNLNFNKFKSLNRELNNSVKKNQIDTRDVTEDPVQKEAIEQFGGPCMVIAGPGSGKTRVLTKRIVHLVTQREVDPRNILAITFSNKATAEIRARIKAYMESAGRDIPNPNIFTFHAFGLSVIRDNCEKLGLSSDFVIEKVDKNDTEQARKPGTIFIDDLISYPVKLFKDHPEILQSYRERYSWILIDEYQDISPDQYELTVLLAGTGNPDLFVIGDPDQAIYGFRGADVRLIDRIKNDYPGIRVINLPKSYRCPGLILKAAGQVLQKQEYLAGKQDDIKIHIQHCGTSKGEADWIASKIESMMGGVRSFSMDSGISDGNAIEGCESFSDYAVLCRTGMMFNDITAAFKNHGIAYQVIGSRAFYQEEPLYSAVKKLYTVTNRDTEVHKSLSEIMKDYDINDDDRRRIIKLAKKYDKDYTGFINSLIIRQGIDDYENIEAVSIMTIHASKGLEFNNVFIPGCEDNIIPFEVFGNKPEQELREEERLLYVGITRGKKSVYLSHADKRSLRGMTLRNNRSRFLDRLEKELILKERTELKNFKKENQLELF
ncbi:MAG: UvrD-helicase domain-containing protein [Oligoflexia bacterium]|nr:UvrD-helicase domain-containing protein [Oligoflexia bacterium]